MLPDRASMTKDPDLFLPEPEPREILGTVISVDDHVVEPIDTFEGRRAGQAGGSGHRGSWRLPRATRSGSSRGSHYTQVGMNAVAGRRPETFGLEPFRFDQMRPGCYDVDARVRDMDMNGVWASVNFPSQITGFCGRVFFMAEDRELGMACIRAWNDWLYEAWHVPTPSASSRSGSRTSPTPSSPQPRSAATPSGGSRRSPSRAASRDRAADPLGPQALGSDHRGVVETDTVDLAARRQLRPHACTAGCSGAAARSDLVRATVSHGLCRVALVRLPAALTRTSKIAMSEGGIGWVAMLLDRLDNIVDRSRYGWAGTSGPPEVLKRNFWFCSIDDPSTIDTRYRIGVENIMVEVDYPHGDSTWPDTQQVIEECWGHLPPAELRAMCSENAAALYRHPLPPAIESCRRTTRTRSRHGASPRPRRSSFRTCLPERSSSCSPAPCGARATATISRATSPSTSATGLFFATHGCSPGPSCGRPR